jgi:TonB family protein
MPLAPFAASKVFTKSERQALEDLFGEDARPNKMSIPRHVALKSQPTVRMRTYDWPARGVARDLLRITGCVPDKGDRRVLSSVVYAPDGSLASGGIDPTGLSPECLRAGKNALMLAVAGREVVVTPNAREMGLIVFERDALACADAFGSARQISSRGTVTSGQQVTAPSKIRNVSPIYPPEAIEAGIQGVVLLEAVISPEGCVASVELQRNVHPLLDLAAFDAVLGWRYTPTLLDARRLR